MLLFSKVNVRMSCHYRAKTLRGTETRGVTNGGQIHLVPLVTIGPKPFGVLKRLSFLMAALALASDVTIGPKPFGVLKQVPTSQTHRGRLETPLGHYRAKTLRGTETREALNFRLLQDSHCIKWSLSGQNPSGY